MKRPIALITGAAGGLGMAFAREAARNNYDLLLIDLPDAHTKDLAVDLATTYHVSAAAVEVDLTQPEALSLIENYVENHGRKVGLLINNAAMASDQSFASESTQHLGMLLQLNVIQTTMLMYRMLPYMYDQPGATILNVSSMAAFFPMPYKSLYAASKAYLRMLSLSLHCEFKSAGVHVAALCPFGIFSNPTHRLRYENGGFFTRQSFLHPHQVATYALKKAKQGQAMIIPGLFCRCLYRFCSIIPLSWQLEMSAKRFATPMAQVQPLNNATPTQAKSYVPSINALA